MPLDAIRKSAYYQTVIQYETFMKRLREYVDEHGSQKAASLAFDCSPQYLGDVLNGKAEPGPLILRAMGYERVVLYKEIKP